MVGTPSEEVRDAITKLRAGHSIPAEASGLLADLLERHNELEIGPGPDGQWPNGWLRVDNAQVDLARVINGSINSAADHR